MTNQAVREPPILQDRILYAYLQEMARQINFAIGQVDVSLDTDSTVIAKASTVAKEAAAQQAASLKALIIKTADDVQSAMAEVKAQMEGSYIAKSEWGNLRQDITSEITATAAGIVQEYGFEEQIESLQNDAASFGAYQTQTLQYIKTGLLYYDADNLPRYGVAVGEKLSTVTVDGVTTLTRNDLCATFTSDRLSFWQGGVEVAYVSNARLYIDNIRVLTKLSIGPWEITHANGFAIKYVGGE